MAAVDGYVGMCNGLSAQQESGAALSENSMFTAVAKNYIITLLWLLYRCALIRDRQPTAHRMTLHVQLRQKQRVSSDSSRERFLKFCIISKRQIL